MKHFLVLLVALVMICSVSIAETLSIDLDTATESDVIAMIDKLSQIHVNMIRERHAKDPIKPTEKDTYALRNVPWGATKAAAEEIMGLKSSRIRKYIYKPSSVSTYPGYPTPQVEGDAGIEVQYDKVNVAGYNATLRIDFIFPIEDGVIIREQDLAQLYMGYYWISDDDYIDIDAIFSDLGTKLIGIYGNPTNGEPSSYFRWSDSSKNKILLQKSSTGSGVLILYFAADAEARVKTMINAIYDERLKQEELDREKNATNVDGL